MITNITALLLAIIGQVSDVVTTWIILGLDQMAALTNTG